MDRSGVKSALRLLGVKQSDIQDMAEWVSIPCLFPWKHQRGRDSSASAGVSIHPHGTSIFSCFSCGTKGTLEWVVNRLQERTGEDYSELIAQLEDEELFALTNFAEEEPEEQGLGTPLDKHSHFSCFDYAIDVKQARDYLKSRGVSREATERMELLFDPVGRSFEGKTPHQATWEPRILFPVFDRAGGLHGFSGRSIWPESKLRVRDYSSLPKRKLLLGSHLLPAKPERVIVVEGLFDYAKMITFNQPAVALMCSSLTRWHEELLKDIGAPIYCCLDNDRAGEKGTKEIIQKLGQYLPVFTTQYPEGVKDAGEVYRDEFELMIANAELA